MKITLWAPNPVDPVPTPHCTIMIVTPAFSPVTYGQSHPPPTYQTVAFAFVTFRSCRILNTITGVFTLATHVPLILNRRPDILRHFFYKHASRSHFGPDYFLSFVHSLVTIVHVRLTRNSHLSRSPPPNDFPICYRYLLSIHTPRHIRMCCSLGVTNTPEVLSTKCLSC